jgi:glutathione-independent formaldehyde dehydrogenase
MRRFAAPKASTACGSALVQAGHLAAHDSAVVGDMIPERLEQARSFGCETVDLRQDASLADQIAEILGEPEVDAAVDCVGFEARGHGPDAGEAPATVLNDIMGVARAGAGLGIPGLYVTGDPGGIDEEAKIGSLRVRLGLGWAKSHRPDSSSGERRSALTRRVAPARY